MPPEECRTRRIILIFQRPSSFQRRLCQGRRRILSRVQRTRSEQRTYDADKIPRRHRSPSRMCRRRCRCCRSIPPDHAQRSRQTPGQRRTTTNMDFTTSTSTTKKLGRHRRSSGTARMQLIWTSTCWTFMGQRQSRKNSRMWLREDKRMGKSLCTSRKADIVRSLC